MRRLPFAICVVCLLTPLGATHAQEERRFLFGLESRFSEQSKYGSAEADLALIPTFSYHLTQRFRLDAFAGVAYSDEGLELSLQPGLRYYLGPQRGKFRFNTGFSVSFTVIDDDDTVVTTDLDGNPVVRSWDDDDEWLRVVPLEVEYWGSERWGLTMALDLRTWFDSDVRRNDGFGVSAGFRFKIR